MPDERGVTVAGVDAGTECVKAVILGADGRVLGRGVAPARGYFQACVYEVLSAALDDAQLNERDLACIGATGFAMDCVPGATLTATEVACHAAGAFHLVERSMTLVSIGGRDPHVIEVRADGRRVEARNVRCCAAGVGSFLMFTARHLDVLPTRLQELASAAERPAAVSSYCSVYSSTGILERLREGATREEIALGAMHSIAERVVEMGGFEDPVHVCGGVVEYFPGVVRAMESLTGMPVRPLPDPIFTAALGAALKAAASVAGLTTPSPGAPQ